LQPNEEWDVIGAPLPTAALTAMHKISAEERPLWARDAIQVMASGMLTMTSESKKKKLLEIRDAWPKKN